MNMRKKLNITGTEHQLLVLANKKIQIIFNFLILTHDVEHVCLLLWLNAEDQLSETFVPLNLSRCVKDGRLVKWSKAVNKRV